MRKISVKNLFLFVAILIAANVNSQTLKGFGDSITEGQGASSEQNSWIHLLAQKLGFGSNYLNYGVPGSTIYQNGIGGKNFINTSSVSLSKDPVSGYITIMYGTNSDGNNGSPEWKAQYQSIIQRFINAGYERNKIILCSPPYNDLFGDGILSVTNAAKEIAANLGIRYADVTSFTKSYGTANIYGSDILHPNDNGNRAIADYIYSVIGASGSTTNNTTPNTGNTPTNNTNTGNTNNLGNSGVTNPVLSSNVTNALLKGFGDAITKGQGASNEQNSWISILAQKLGVNNNYKNYGVPSSTVYRGGVAQNNFIDLSAASISKDPVQGYITIMYGSNSDGNNGSQEWKAQYQSIIQRFIDAGYERHKIILASPPYNSLFGDGILPIADAAREIAANLGIKFADVTGYTKAYGLANIYGNDILNPNDNGNKVIADYVYTVIASSNPNPTPTPNPSQNNGGQIISAGGNNGNTSNGVVVKGFGDAITKGQGASNEQNSWIRLLAQKLGNPNGYINYGVPSSTVYQNGIAGKNFIDMSSVSISKDPVSGYITIMYGSNSDGNNGSTEWKSQYQNIIQRFIDAGYERSKIILCSPPYNDLFGDGILPIDNAAKEIAANLGIKFADVTAYTKAFGTNNIYNKEEILNPNDNGNKVIADYVYSVIIGNPIAFGAKVAAEPLPAQSGSLEITENNGVYTASFIAAHASDSKKFRLMYSEDGKSFKEIYVVMPEKLEEGKPYSFTFKITN